MWTFGKKLALGVLLSFILLLVIATVAYRGITSLADTGYWVDHTHTVIQVGRDALALLKDAEASQRGFVITGDDEFLEPYRAADTELPRLLKRLRDLTVDNPTEQRYLDRLEPLVSEKVAEMNRIVQIRKDQGFDAASKAVAMGVGRRLSEEATRLLSQVESEERRLLKVRADEADAAATWARSTLLYGTALCALVALVAGWFLSTSLSSQVGSAVQHIQSSSVELQASANQQATGSKQQAAAMAEITTTISELLSTSRQIAESAQQVAKIASETTLAARGGDGIVQRTQDSVAGIRSQVDVIVNHMLELGRKSQQIGGILDIINELSEQTNILSINATIEAAGAGEMGRRFAVVAEEIRKLSDRVGGSTKDIRALVDDIRAAVNTTVMATESGSKAVDAGSRQFGEVAEAFSRIVALVSTTTDAAREIELSTKQQASAVEQVNIAASNVAQATRESESSSVETLQTASQLAALSRDLTRLVRPPVSA